MEKLVLLNSAVMTVDGVYSIRSIDFEEARKIVQSANQIESYIGHESTAKLLSELFGRDIPMNRSMYRHEKNVPVLVVSLSFRLDSSTDLKDIDLSKLKFAVVERIE